MDLITIFDKTYKQTNNIHILTSSSDVGSNASGIRADSEYRYLKLVREGGGFELLSKSANISSLPYLKYKCFK